MEVKMDNTEWFPVHQKLSSSQLAGVTSSTKCFAPYYTPF